MHKRGKMRMACGTILAASAVALAAHGALDARDSGAKEETVAVVASDEQVSPAPRHDPNLVAFISGPYLDRQFPSIA
jgi:hypothetical protein